MPYELLWGTPFVEQRPEARSFQGGLPHLPPDLAIPDCRCCGSQLAFFLQLELPDGLLADHLFSIWCCVVCTGDDKFIPEMPDAPLFGVDLPEGFLERYQTFFRLEVALAEGSSIRVDYEPRVVYQEIALRPTDKEEPTDRLGGEPSWILDDETPGSYMGGGFEFLLQIMEDRDFPILPDAPHQMVMNPFISREPTPREEQVYELFVMNRLFFFVAEAKPRMIYVFPQVD
jgi:hypothetical protein